MGGGRAEAGAGHSSIPRGDGNDEKSLVSWDWSEGVGTGSGGIAEDCKQENS